MSQPDPSNHLTLPPSLARRLDEACDRFESACKAGQQPRLEDYLADSADPERSVWLRELLALELAYRTRPWPTQEEYCQRFPGHSELIRAAFREAGPAAGSEESGALPPQGEDLLAIPGYKLLEQVGQGGMGVVWKARQEDPRRTVALKMIRDSALAGPHERSRFRAEADIVARFQHPHIVQIHSWGEHAGRPYFVLEFVDGGSLAGQLRGAPLAAPVAAALTETLARAVHYAHQAGIVHRDLKPANILLQIADRRLPIADSAGQSAICDLQSAIPKITDFGLAKFLEGAPRVSTQGEPGVSAPGGQTQSGAILGTPSYMAPEQAQGKSKEVGPAADVYALGAILYELLTGRPPFRGETVLDTLQQVVSEEPVPPARLNPRVPSDLETVCLHCLRKEPAWRYASAETLAEDLRRFQAGEPIQARPASWWERGVKWARRRPTAAVLAGVSILALLSLLAGAAWHNARLQTERDRAESHAREAQTQKERAQERLRLARAAVDRLLTRVGRESLAHVPLMEPVRRQLLQDALQFYRTFLKENSTDPDLRQETARAYRRVGDIQTLLGQYAAAEKAYGQACTLSKGLVEQFPREPAYRLDWAAALNNLGNLLHSTNRFAEALAAFRQARAERRRLVREHPRADQYREHLAASYYNLGNLLNQTGRPQEAEESYGRALALYRQLVKQDRTVAEYWQALARTQKSLAALLAGRGRVAEAEEAYGRALGWQQHLAGQFGQLPEFREELALTWSDLGSLLWNHTGRSGAAEQAQRRALALRQKLAEEFPSVPDYRRQLAISYNNLGVVLQDTGRPRQAEQAYRQALALRQYLAHEFPKVPDYQSDLADSHTDLGRFYQDTGRPREAGDAYRQALVLRRKLVKEFPQVPGYRLDLARSHFLRGTLFRTTGPARKAEAAFRQAEELQRQLARAFPNVPRYRQELANSHYQRGLVLQDLGRLAAAENAFRLALGLHEQLASTFPRMPRYQEEQAGSQNSLGLVLKATGRPRQAAQAFTMARTLQQRLVVYHPDFPAYRGELGGTLHNLAGLLTEPPPGPVPLTRWLSDPRRTLANLVRARSRRARLTEARRLLEQAIGQQQVALKANPRHPLFRAFLRNHYWCLADVLLGLEDHAGAAQAAHQMRQVFPESPADACRAACYLGHCLALAFQDSRLAPEQRQALGQRYGDRALALLQRAIHNGYRDGDALKREPALKRLLSRADFQHLLRGLEKEKAE